jgi:UDP-N-acetylmuramate dehydrogenase
MVVDPSDPDSKSAGSFFTNPVVNDDRFQALQQRWAALGNTSPIPAYAAGSQHKIPAAWLVEHAGFTRGLRRGGVGISSKHALALVNYDGSTRELLSLAAEIQQGVFSNFGVQLEIEPVTADEQFRRTVHE